MLDSAATMSDIASSAPPSGPGSPKGGGGAGAGGVLEEQQSSGDARPLAGGAAASAADLLSASLLAELGLGGSPQVERSGAADFLADSPAAALRALAASGRPRASGEPALVVAGGSCAPPAAKGKYVRPSRR